MQPEVDLLITELNGEQDFLRKAQLMQTLTKKHGVSIKHLSERTHMKPAYVCHVLRLNRLPDMIVDGYYANLVSLSHLFVLSRIKDVEKMVSVYEKILSDNFTVLQTEAAVRDALYNVSSTGEKLSRDEVHAFVDSVKTETDDVKVEVLQTRIKGRISIEVKGNVEKTSQLLREYMNRLKAKAE